MWKTTDSVFAQSLHDTRLPGHPVVVAQDFILLKLQAGMESRMKKALSMLPLWTTL